MASLLNRRMSITTALIIANIAIFVLGGLYKVPAFFGIHFPGSPYYESLTLVRGAYSWFTCFMEWEVWRLISYQFLHAGTMHLVFNMWALYFFGPAVENAMGSGRFIIFYLSCGIAGALFYSLLAGSGLFDSSLSTLQESYIAQLANYVGYDHLELWQLTPMVGASAAIYGILVAVAFMYPHMLIRLVFPPITMTLRTFALAVLGIAVLTVIVNGHNAGGEAGHLGGIIFSAIIMSIWRWRFIRRRNNDRTF